jgi:hypothetical protein
MVLKKLPPFPADAAAAALGVCVFGCAAITDDDGGGSATPVNSDSVLSELVDTDAPNKPGAGDNRGEICGLAKYDDGGCEMAVIGVGGEG